MTETTNLFTDGKAYERLMGRWSKLVGEQFLDWVDAPKGLRWIDVGCGNAAFTEVLISRCAPIGVTGIDPSAGQLDYARTRPGAKLAQFQLGDAQTLPFADGHFDAATMALVITFIPDPVKAASEMARVVKTGGTVATYMWDFPGGGFPLSPMIEALAAMGIRPSPASNPDASRRETMRAIWQKAGLKDIDTRIIRVPIVYADFDDFWDSNTMPMGSYGQAIAGLSPGEREALKARLREQLPARADGRIAYEAFANAAKGRVP